MIAKTPDTDATLIEKLKAAPFFKVYQDAFRAATGLPLALTEVESNGFSTCSDSPNQNPFCVALNSGSSSCAECKHSQKCLLQEAEQRTRTQKCFVGLNESIVPVRLGGRTVGLLKTGQVLAHPPTAEEITAVEQSLKDAGCSDSRVRSLMDLYRATPVIEEHSYAGMMTILSAFALQLAALMNRVVLEARNSEPETVRKAKAYIMDHIDEKMSLETVAAEVSVSTFYLCKMFKQATGMTFTEFVNRQRVELAKGELLKPNRRITEIAYDVGYQSLSQFNRSFLKFVGESPTLYRRRMLSGSAGAGAPRLVA
ncbi:MAG: AraC-like DNA-binding protein/ligand-binding sensor protein [Verrucomicrobiales bacterium]|jgi:AraC-like DNA-binding protein/ligand-binding sensor protein